MSDAVQATAADAVVASKSWRAWRAWACRVGRSAASDSIRTRFELIGKSDIHRRSADAPKEYYRKTVLVRECCTLALQSLLQRRKHEPISLQFM